MNSNNIVEEFIQGTLYSNVVTIKVVGFNQGNKVPLYNTQTSNIVLHVGLYGKPI